MMAATDGEQPISASKVSQQLTVNYRFIVENLTSVDTILDELITCRILNIDDRQLVDSKETVQGKVRKLLEILFPKPNNAIIVFVESLKSDNVHVYKKILETELKETTGDISPSVTVSERETLTVFLKICLSSALEESPGTVLDLSDVIAHVADIRDQNALPHDITPADIKSTIKSEYPKAVIQILDGAKLITRVKNVNWKNGVIGKAQTPSKETPTITGTIECLRMGDLHDTTTDEPAGDTNTKVDASKVDVNEVSFVLCQEGGRCEVTKLMGAVEKNNREYATSLMEGGAAVDTEDTFGRTALYIASREGHIDMVRLLAGAGADMESTGVLGSTPLITACLNDHSEVATYLVEQGADVNATNRLGVTSLMYSVFQTPNPSLAAFLISKNADINHMDKEHVSALMSTLTMDKPHLNTVKLLIAHGANVNAKDKEGDTALHHAIRRKSPKDVRKVVKVLLSYGANPNIKNKRSEIALDLVHGGIDGWLVKKMIKSQSIKLHI